MKKLIGAVFFCLFALSGCKIECNSPQTARDDNYGVNTGNSYSNESLGDDKTSGILAAKTGTGDEVLTNLAFKKGPVIFTLSHDGQGNFIVKMLDSNGIVVATLVDKVGNYSGKVVVQVPKDSDNYILEIQADGKWQMVPSKADEKGQ
ncbi:hypothetical protein A5821_000852 [Enterococcus sp. 7F3_DIV0205]|uniref:Lipoprotein n=1 Tax=Candidatus Enterococcus palustris TaxID=1834189 RepID=A0AAQ3W978_9ENTE|nr:hypothetical protein [Enterococcus sp. 7F3_DIV0205]OTN85267.1 hypothetical protein A5821_001196 [Enterococcus sp. 7F3_DIV0205]